MLKNTQRGYNRCAPILETVLGPLHYASLSAAKKRSYDKHDKPDDEYCEQDRQNCDKIVRLFNIHFCRAPLTDNVHSFIKNVLRVYTGHVTV